MRAIAARILLPVLGLCSLGPSPAPAANQVLLRLLDPADGTPQAIAADSSGHLFVVSSLPTTPQPQTRVVKLNLDGTRLATLDIPQVAYPKAAFTDPQGNLILAGADSSYQGRVLKVDPLLHAPLFSMSLPAAIYAVASDAAGNVYLTGQTSSAAFPVTSGAYQTRPPLQDPLRGNSAVYAFLTEIASDGSSLLYSTYFGDDATICIGGSSCVGAHGSTAGTALALDSSGGVVIAGNSDANNLPTTPGALAPDCACRYRFPAGFLARFQPGAAQQLQQSTFLTAPSVPYNSVAVDALALDAAGNPILGGSGPATLPTTAGSLQPAPIPVPGTANAAGFVIKLNRAGTAVVWGTFFGGSPSANVKAIAVDAQGRVLFTGSTLNPYQPSAPSVPPYLSAYVARLASDGSSLAAYYPGPFGLVGQGLAIASAGTFAAVGSSGGLWIETAAAGPSLLAIANAAGGGSLTTVAPYELVSLYGLAIGPPAPLAGQVVNGAFTTSLGGYQVLFNGIPAPLLYAGAGQINAVVPSRIGAFASTRIQLVTPQGTVDGPTAFVAASVPSVFVNWQTGLAAALNQDGSVNSPANPAKPGSIVSVFASGGGPAGYFNDGSIVPIGIFSTSVPVWAVSGLLSLEVDFAGAAPGLVSGVMQINFRLPDPLPSTGTGTFSFGFEIGEVATNTVQIAAAP